MKSIIIYFSRAGENYFQGQIRSITKGNTEIVAEQIAEITGATLFKVERETPYAVNYNACIKEAKEEMNSDSLPKVKKSLLSIEEYDVVFIGGPIYWGTYPQSLFTVLSQLDFNGKIVMPFVTHEGSRFASTRNDLQRYCKGAEIKEGLAISGSEVAKAKPEVEQWIKSQIDLGEDPAPFTRF